VRLRGQDGKGSIRPGVSSAGSDVSPGGRGHRQGQGAGPAMTRGHGGRRDRRRYRTLMARAMTSATRTIEQPASSIIISLAHGLIAEMSVGLTAVEVQKDSER